MEEDEDIANAEEEGAEELMLDAHAMIFFGRRPAAGA